MLPGSENLVQDLANKNLSTELLSGDRRKKTKSLALKLGFENWMSSVSPESKQQRIAELSDQNQAPCMVGDGLNDTAALARAHASIAPGAALDAARSAADVIMIGRSLALIPEVFEIARKTVKLSKQNFRIATVYNAVAIPSAVLGYATPLLAALAMSTSSLTVLANAMRLNLGAK